MRVVNISWALSPRSYEYALERNNLGADADERKALATKLFKIERDGLYDAIKGSPNILFICASANADTKGAPDDTIPSSFKLPNLLTVGAVDQAGDETSFTSHADTVLVDANGYEVDSVTPGGVHIRLSGPSTAAPAVTNLAAKLLALNTALTPEQVIHLIVEGSTPSADGRLHLINPKHSVELLKAMPQPAAAKKHK